VRDRLARGLLVAGAAAALLQAAGDASACSVCFSGDEQTRHAYYLTTALLIALPFGVFGALLLWLWRASRAQRLQAAGSSVPCDSAEPR
jgi:hypothetical protein